MVTVHAMEPVPRNGSTSPSARFDVVGLEAALEAAICRAWREARSGQKKGDMHMTTSVLQMRKPVELAPQQASSATECPSDTSNVSGTQRICQEALGTILATAAEKAKGEYEAALEAFKLVARETDLLQVKIASIQSKLAQATSEAQEEDEADQSALEDTRARAKEALAPYVAAGVVSSDEVELHLESALREAGERLLAARQEALLVIESLLEEMEELHRKKANLDSRQAALCERQTQLLALPCIVALEQARREEERRNAEATRDAIRFVETASWHELSWQKQLTPELEKVVALAGEDRTVFDALVTRLGRELDQVNAARPGLGWSVVRAIESLELGRLFPTLETKRAELVQAARRHNSGGQGHRAMADKVVSLAFRWGARVAGR